MASANLGNTYSYSFVQGHSSFSRGKFYFSSFVYQVLNLSDGVLIYKALEKNKNTLNKTTLNNKKKKKKTDPLIIKMKPNGNIPGNRGRFRFEVLLFEC